MNLSDFEIIEAEPPHDNVILVKIVAEIINNETEEVRESTQEGVWDEDNNSPSIFIWEEGNFSCDCNRASFFGDRNDDCGDHRYSVNLKNPKTGEYFYKEF